MKFKLAILSAVISLQSASAGIVFNVETAGVQQTSFSGVLTETFNLLPVGPLGAHTSVIGDYSTGGQISNPNAWGGSNQTNYIALGAQSNTTSYTIDFKRYLTYFGVYWAAGDYLNELRFYNNGALVQSFNTTTILSPLSSAYSGNPNNGQNMGEKYAYVNFTTTQGSLFDQVMFYNYGTGTGFETDNHSILGVTPENFNPTAETPEPATLALVGAACIALGVMRRR